MVRGLRCRPALSLFSPLVVCVCVAPPLAPILRSPVLFLLLHLGSLPQLLVTLGNSEVKALMLQKSLFLRLSTPHLLQIS